MNLVKIEKLVKKSADWGWRFQIIERSSLLASYLWISMEGLIGLSVRHSYLVL